MNRRRMSGHRAGGAAVAVDPLLDVAAYWKFEGTTQTIDDAIGAHDLLLNSSTNVTWTAGKNNNSFTHTNNTNTRFSGFENTPGSILDPSNNSSEHQAFSFSIWQKLAIASFAAPASPMSPALAICGNGSIWSWFLWREYHAGNYATVKFATRDSAEVIDTIEGTGLSFGDAGWHHYCVTRAAGANSTIGLYFDGTLVDAGISTGLSAVGASVSSGFSIGSLVATGQQLTAIFRNLGQTDEAGYWNRELNQDEVAYLYNAGAGNFLP